MNSVIAAVRLLMDFRFMLKLQNHQLADLPKMEGDTTVKDKFNFKKQDALQVKGKGTMQTYYLDD